MTDEKREPIRTEQQAMPGYTRTVRIYRGTCALPECGTEFEGPARQRYCCHLHAVRHRDQVDVAGARERHRQYRQRKREQKG